MSRVWLLIACAIALAACDPPPEAEARLLCTTVCNCIAAPLPSAQDECVSQCVSEGDVKNASQACEECIFTHADRCASLVNDCSTACDRNPMGEPFPDAPIVGGGN